MAYAEIKGYVDGDLSRVRTISVEIETSQIRMTDSIEKLFGLVEVAMPPSFTFQYIEVRDAGRWRYTINGSTWSRSRV